MKTEIVAVADGEVIASGPSAITKTKKAKYVKIQHANNTVSLYAHLSNNDIVKIGQKVSAGQVIGLSGDTGTPGSPHLHFEFSNVNAFKYYRDKYPLHYRVWIKNAYYKRKDSISEGDRREFEEAINWISSHGDRSFIN